MAYIGNLTTLLSGDDLYWAIKHFLLAKVKLPCKITSIEIKKNQLLICGNYPKKFLFLSKRSFRCSLTKFSVLQNNVLAQITFQKPLINKLLENLKELLSKNDLIHFNKDTVIFDASAISKKLDFVDIHINEVSIEDNQLMINLSNSSFDFSRLL